MAVLRLNQQGFPSRWISLEHAAVMITKNRVSWSLGENITILRGGISKLGIVSRLPIPEIIAVNGNSHFQETAPVLLNRFLFKRDNNQCLYCGNYFHCIHLTRDHVIPKGRGGLDTWTNVVTACKRCNNYKACRTPEESGMELLAVPFTPNPYEFMYLASHNIKPNQMCYLSDRFSLQRNWVA